MSAELVRRPESPVRLYVEHPDGFEGTGFYGGNISPLIRDNVNDVASGSNARFVGRPELPPVDQRGEQNNGDTSRSTSG